VRRQNLKAGREIQAEEKRAGGKDIEQEWRCLILPYDFDR